MSGQRQVRFYNNTGYPIQSFAFWHFTDKNNPRNGTLHGFYTSPNIPNPDNNEFRYQQSRDYYEFHVDFYKKSHCYIVWHNEHDNAVYYITHGLTFWQKLEQKVVDLFVKEMGKAINICTESKAGTVVSKITQHMIDNFIETKENAPIIDLNFDDDPGHGLDIELRVDRNEKDKAVRMQVYHTAKYHEIRSYTRPDFKNN
jgi:hypothetical protein